MAKSASSKTIFINCPFDLRYRLMLEALVFVTYDLGFVPRCALEEYDGSDLAEGKSIKDSITSPCCKRPAYAFDAHR